MSSIDQAINLGLRIKSGRRLMRMSQQKLAQKIDNSRDLIVRMERGENVGVHHLIAALNVLGLKIDISNEHVVPGNFDNFYQQNIRNKLVEEVRNNANPYSAGLFQPKDKPKIKISNWKNAVKL